MLFRERKRGRNGSLAPENANLAALCCTTGWFSMKQAVHCLLRLHWGVSRNTIPFQPRHDPICVQVLSRITHNLQYFFTFIERIHTLFSLTLGISKMPYYTKEDQENQECMRNIDRGSCGSLFLDCFRQQNHLSRSCWLLCRSNRHIRNGAGLRWS